MPTPCPITAVQALFVAYFAMAAGGWLGYLIGWDKGFMRAVKVGQDKDREYEGHGL